MKLKQWHKYIGLAILVILAALWLDCLYGCSLNPSLVKIDGDKLARLVAARVADHPEHTDWKIFTSIFATAVAVIGHRMWWHKKRNK